MPHPPIRDERYKLTDRQLSLAIDMLKAGRIWLSQESASDYIEAAGFIFKKGLVFYPGVALDDLVAEQIRRSTTPPEGE